MKPEATRLKLESKPYASVSEMTRSLTDPDFANDFDKHLSDRGLVKMMTVLRCRKGLTQADVAERMECGQAKISKLETSTDFDLNFGDIVKYVDSIGGSIRLVLMPIQSNGANHIRFHVGRIKQELNGLVRLAGDDQSIGQGVEKLAIDQVMKLIEVVEESLNELPSRGQRQRSPLCIEAEGERGESLPTDAPRRVRKKGLKPVLPE